ncbi:MAG TPA: UbiA family prenyltransferase, partial [Myxococcota bacterium]|nr:UbiA family prenyltransferase [Myxococcota bacterium]
MFVEQAVDLAPRLALRDVAALAKPRLSMLVLCTTGVGLWLAPGSLPLGRSLLTLLASALVVGAANGLNCYLERDSDALMRRTRMRPLPARRMEP